MSGYREIHRGAVAAWECDIMGHMNVQFYTAHLVEGLAHIARALAIEPGELTLRHTRIQHKRELRAGEPFRIEAAVQRVEAGAMDLHARLIAEGDGAVGADYSVQVNCPRDLLPLADLVVPRADMPRPSAAGTPSEPTATGLHEPFLAARGAAEAWQMDAGARLAPGYTVAIVMSAIGALRHKLELGPRQLGDARIGTAALEYDFRYLAPIRAGEIYSDWCGMLALGPKTFRFGHRIENDSTGETAALVEVVNVMFDLDERRALAMPARQRRLAEALIISWPPAACG